MVPTKKQCSTKTKAMDANHPAVVAAAAKQAEAKKITAVSYAIPPCYSPPCLAKDIVNNVPFCLRLGLQ
jgi:hypothetical protein